MTPEIILNTIYIHAESGKPVMTLYKGEMKHDNVWEPSITYCHDGRIYTREETAFAEKFYRAE